MNLSNPKNATVIQMQNNSILDRLSFICLDTPGNVGDIDDIFTELDLSLQQLSEAFVNQGKADGYLNDPRVRIFFAFCIRQIRSEISSSNSRKSTFLSLGELANLAIEGAVDMIEYSWIGSIDVDAVEYHYWACGVLAEFDPKLCEHRVLERLQETKKELYQIALIQAIGVLADQSHLSGIRTPTIMYLLSILRNNKQPRKVRDAVRETLVEDILRIDGHLSFLEDRIRKQIENVAKA